MQTVCLSQTVLGLIFCQTQTGFSRRTLDQGHLLGFIDLHGCPDVSSHPPAPSTPPPASKCVSSPSSSVPPLLLLLLSSLVSLQHLSRAKAARRVLQDSLTTAPLPHPRTLILIIHLLLQTSPALLPPNQHHNQWAEKLTKNVLNFSHCVSSLETTNFHPHGSGSSF